MAELLDYGVEGQEPEVGRYDKFVLVEYDDGSFGYFADQEFQQGSAIRCRDVVDNFGIDSEINGGGLAALVDGVLRLSSRSITYGTPDLEKLEEVSGDVAEAYEETYGIEVDGVEIDLDHGKKEEESSIDWSEPSFLERSDEHFTDLL